MRRILFVALAFIVSNSAGAQTPSAVNDFITVDAPVVALTHVRIIDGTGTAPREDQTIVINAGRIELVGNSNVLEPPALAKVLDLHGYTVIPGLVGMHDHLFYPNQVAERGPGWLALYHEMGFSFPRLYLASGVTTLRTTGSVEPYTDLEIKKLIDEGREPGPKIQVTGPYLEGAGAYTPQMHELTGPDDARKTVDYWADEGATSFKAYMHITHAELAAAIQESHKRGLKITGHLCSIGFREAAALGIDDLEHGLFVDTEFVPGKRPDVCPSQQETMATMATLDIASAPVQAMIRDLVKRHVAVTSTLPVFEISLPNRPPLEQRVLDALSPAARLDYLAVRSFVSERQNSFPEAWKKELEFERDFVKAGGLLLAGEDPTGYGGDLAGFGDQREVELLVEAGFTPVEAIHIATANGAGYLGLAGQIGAIRTGQEADMVVIHGNPAADINDIEKVETVFKDGVGYDSAKLIESVKGRVGFE
ncbi:MAG TPA: amidohydrolase family protein [Terriglobia bacterium]|nr:amidohydrolase family protein [Terriglobia bacterium]